jgi:hypothetical protein
MSLHCPIFSDGVGGVPLISIPVRLSTCFEEALSWSGKWSRDRRRHLQPAQRDLHALCRLRDRKLLLSDLHGFPVRLLQVS